MKYDYKSCSILFLGGSGSGTKVFTQSRCDDKEYEELCSSELDSHELCIDYGKEKCNKDASCKGISHQKDNRLWYCNTSEIENQVRPWWNSYMKPEAGTYLMFLWDVKRRCVSKVVFRKPC